MMTILYNDWLRQNNAEDTPGNRAAWQRETAPIWSAPPGFFGIPKDLHPPTFEAATGGTIVSDNWGVPSHRDFEAPTIPTPTDGQVPHPGIEWKNLEYQPYLALVDGFDIVFNKDEGAYEFATGDIFVEDCTPETIDKIIDKLQHFKRVVFGDNDTPHK